MPTGGYCDGINAYTFVRRSLHTAPPSSCRQCSVRPRCGRLTARFSKIVGVSERWGMFPLCGRWCQGYPIPHVQPSKMFAANGLPMPWEPCPCFLSQRTPIPLGINEGNTWKEKMSPQICTLPNSNFSLVSNNCHVASYIFSIKKMPGRKTRTLMFYKSHKNDHCRRDKSTSLPLLLISLGRV